MGAGTDCGHADGRRRPAWEPERVPEGERWGSAVARQRYCAQGAPGRKALLAQYRARHAHRNVSFAGVCVTLAGTDTAAARRVRERLL